MKAVLAPGASCTHQGFGQARLAPGRNTLLSAPKGPRPLCSVPGLPVASSSSRVLSSSSSLAPSRRVYRARGRMSAFAMDLSDIETQTSLAGVVLGCLMGVGVPVWYVRNSDRDNERLEELRALNRATFQKTGAYMTPEEIERFRRRKWTDGKEFADDD